MAQRNSDFERRPRDLYETPAWVTRVIVRHLLQHVTADPTHYRLWEPAAGTGKMVDVLRQSGFSVWATDIAADPSLDCTADFLSDIGSVGGGIVTNPPYNRADEFVRAALCKTEKTGGCVAMLLKADFDSGSTRTDVFRDCPAWGTKIILMDRIMWFTPPPPKPGGKKAGPSENHAWYVWNWQRDRTLPPTIAYARNDTPKPASAREALRDKAKAHQLQLEGTTR